MVGVSEKRKETVSGKFLSDLLSTKQMGEKRKLSRQGLTEMLVGNANITLLPPLKNTSNPESSVATCGLYDVTKINNRS